MGEVKSGAAAGWRGAVVRALLSRVVGGSVALPRKRLGCCRAGVLAPVPAGTGRLVVGERGRCQAAAGSARMRLSALM